uniref:U-box domain-containing protein n=1 Tax=Trieres chinensis TaxID=1514140 RepID=A0A7S1Z7A3_TRICV|mmetsp:Transcript_19284/g.39100  ORF Transcript_19284/g.39100 Transcript_19284/m.39100 type:complete len:267 (+) Transcript_19284:129-929(+)
MTNVRKRRREDEPGEAPEDAQRYKAMIRSTVDEFICPITLELPVEPVAAEDGHFYERASIQKWMDHQGENVRSPMTNEPMGRRLIPAVQIRAAITRLVRSGAVDSVIAAQWNRRMKDEAHISALKNAAESGDPDAMCELGSTYANMTDGQRGADPSEAYKWFKRAADCGHVGGMAAAGSYLVEKNDSEGMLLLKMAAEGGSVLAAFSFGLWYRAGRYGLPQSNERAKFWFEKVVDKSRNIPDVADFCCDMATMYLQQLQEIDVSSN